MNANELMIGDWVLYPYQENEIRPGEIVYISESGSVGIAFDNGMEITTNLCYCKPIPLTPEILEKIGFKWDYYHKLLIIVYGTMHIGWGFYKDCLSISDWSNDGDNQISSLRCVYVHELQHALRLCGIEKEIEL